MGIIAAVTPGTKRQMPVPRCSVTAADVVAAGKIGKHFYNGTSCASFPLIYKKLRNLRYNDPTWKLDLLWKVAWPIRSPRLMWSGMLQAVNYGAHPGKSSVTFLPMIDMNASDMSCVYSTIRFVAAECKGQRLKRILTFDQPLWRKVQLIIADEPSDSDLSSVVLRLGGFHTEMRSLGCTGSAMSASSTEELLEVVYAQNTVGYMLSGKALARAVREYLLVDSALNSMMTAQAFDTPLLDIHMTGNKELITVEEHEAVESQRETETSDTRAGIQEDLQELIHMYDKLIAGHISADAVCLEKLLDRLNGKLEEQKGTMACHTTARLWLQYMQIIDLRRQFIKASRTDGRLESSYAVTPGNVAVFCCCGA